VAEQVKLLYTQVRTGFVATLLNTGIVTIVLWQVVPHTALISWLALIVTITLARFVLVQKYQQAAPTTDQIHQWRTLFIVGAGAAGLSWGVAGIFLFPAESIAHQVFLVFILGGMAAPLRHCRQTWGLFLLSFFRLCSLLPCDS
jgi:hypothetical protein